MRAPGKGGIVARMRLACVLIGAALLVSAGAGALTMTHPNSTTTLHERAADWKAAGLKNLTVQGDTLSLAPGAASGTLTGAPLSALPGVQRYQLKVYARLPTAFGLGGQGQTRRAWKPLVAFARSRCISARSG